MATKEINNTPFDDINKLLTTLSYLLKEAVNHNLVGIYLYGSLVWGDFNYDSSDIDILVVLKAGIVEKELPKLSEVHALLENHFPFWKNRLEIAYISEIVLAHFKSDMGTIALVSPGEPLGIKVPGADWLINYYLIQNKSIVLLGPDPALIIAKVTKEEFVKNVKEQVLEWKPWIEHTKNSLGYQYHAVLTICRGFYVLANDGEQVSKPQSGNWMVTKFPQWESLIKRALAQNKPNELTKEELEDNYQEVCKFTNEIIELIENKF